jgi:hypothetical protein
MRNKALFIISLEVAMSTFGAPPEERLAALSDTQLEDLGEALLDFAQPSDLADWLRDHRL